MSYDTRYTLKAEAAPGHVAITGVDINLLVTELPDNWWKYYTSRENEAISEAMSWYSHEDHMRALSTKYPYLLFTLHGEGEEFQDIWRKYFVNGQMQEAKASITFAVFDPAELQ